MRKIESFLNWLTDMDWGWWPLLHLRPAKSEFINNSVLLKLTPVFGTMASIIALLPNWPFSVQFGISVFVACWISFFIVYKFTFALAWNRRAKRNAKGVSIQGNLAELRVLSPFVQKYAQKPPSHSVRKLRR